MQIEVRGHSVEIGRVLREQVAQVLVRKFGREGMRFGRVSARLGTPEGDSELGARSCRLEVEVAGRGSVVTEERRENYFAASEAAVDSAVSVLREMHEAIRTRGLRDGAGSGEATAPVAGYGGGTGRRQLTDGDLLHG